MRVVMFGCQTRGRRTLHAFLDPAHDRATAVTDPRGGRAREKTRSEPAATR
ncbi:methionyl-tRNA formyltransferase, partial [Streptomyces sp. FT05W]